MNFKLTPEQIDIIVGIALEVQAETPITTLSYPEQHDAKMRRIHSKINNELMLPIFKKSECSSSIKPLVEPFK